jgi:uncharacterized metal-binding protein
MLTGERSHDMKLPDCAHCDLPRPEKACLVEEGKGHKGCPSIRRDDLVEKAMEVYARDDVAEFARQASIQEGVGYSRRSGQGRGPAKTRIVEVCEFARRMGFERLGLVHCIGLVQEAKLVTEILQGWDFEVVSVVCKVGSVPKERIGVEDDEKIRPGQRETMCNPVMQAKVVNEAKTDFNVVMGLCVGHDSMFLKHAEAPCTVLVVKDRVTGHNPLAAINTAHSYYASVKRPTGES